MLLEMLASAVVKTTAKVGMKKIANGIDEKYGRIQDIENKIENYIYINFTQYNSEVLSFWKLGGRNPTTEMIKENVSKNKSVKNTYKILKKMKQKKILDVVEGTDSDRINQIQWKQIK